MTKDITIQDYSEKAVLVVGPDTRKYKEDLKLLGATWNTALKGWIISLSKKPAVEKFISQPGHIVSKKDLEAAEARDAAYTAERKSKTKSSPSTKSNTSDAKVIAYIKRLEDKIDKLTAIVSTLIHKTKPVNNDIESDLESDVEDEDEDEESHPVRLMK
jgi:hypothetical protein